MKLILQTIDTNFSTPYANHYAFKNVVVNTS